MTLAELGDVARQTGLSHDELNASLTHVGDAGEAASTDRRQRARLTALVFHSLPAGVHPEDLARQLGWTLSAVYSTIQAVMDHQPDGIRLCITGDGRLVLRPDDTGLDTNPNDLNHPTDPGFRLEDPDLAASLWHLCDHDPTADIPEHHLATLRAAGLISTDGRNNYPRVDIAHSLRFY